MKYSYLFQDPYISKTILKKINILFNSVRTRPGMYFGTNISLDILNMYIQGIIMNLESDRNIPENSVIPSFYFRNLHDFSHKWCLETYSVYVTGTIGYSGVLSRIFGNNIIGLDYFFDMWNDYIDEKYYEKDNTKNTLPYYQMKDTEVSETDILKFFHSFNRDLSEIKIYLFKESCFQHLKIYKDKKEAIIPKEALFILHEFFYESFEHGIYSLEITENSLLTKETNCRNFISDSSLSLKDSALLWEKHNL